MFGSNQEILVALHAVSALRESHISSILKIGRLLPPPCGEVGAQRRVGVAKGETFAGWAPVKEKTWQERPAPFETLRKGFAPQGEGA